jgi:hypothetical protein
MCDLCWSERYAALFQTNHWVGFMENSSESKGRRKNIIWPDITHLDGAKTAACSGLWAACFAAFATAGLALYSEFVSTLLIFDIWGLLDSVLFAVIAIGIWRMSRIAAIFGLILYLGEQWYQWTTDGMGNIVVALLLTLMFVNGVRGTIAFHRFKKPSDEP